MIGKNVLTDFCTQAVLPSIGAGSYLHPLAAVIGQVTVGRGVMICPQAAIRGDEGYPIYIGDAANVQDGVVIHALETEHDGKPVDKNLVTVAGKRYAVYVGERVSLAHQSQVHGPAAVLADTFVGMKALVFKSIVGARCVIEPGVILMGVSVPEHRCVPAGAVITRQAEADRLPEITAAYPLKDMNREVVHVNTALAKGYLSDR